MRYHAAWQLRLGRSATIASIVPEVSNPLFDAIAEGVEQRAAAHDVSVVIANSNRSRAREEAHREMFQAQRAQGLLVASHEPIEDRLITVRQRGVPSVLVGQRCTFADQPSVSVDDVAEPDGVRAGDGPRASRLGAAG